MLNPEAYRPIYLQLSCLGSEPTLDVLEPRSTKPHEGLVRLSFWLSKLQIDYPPDDQFPFSRTGLIALDRTIETMAERDLGTGIAVAAYELPGDAVNIKRVIHIGARCDHSST